MGWGEMTLEEMTEDAIDYIYSNMSDSVLTKWESDFMSSTEDQWHRNRRLSDKQKEVLGRIWDKQP